ncbi:MAG TPA: UDP-glucose/GDP-mannose dehydrogenase family protein [Stenomitos sp.]
MRVCVIGTGYVGLVTGACLAEIGHDVIGVDKDPHKIALLQQGQIPIYEPGLEELVGLHGLTGHLQFTTDLPQAVRHSEIVFITVGTPALPSGEPDLSAVEAVARSIGQALNGYKVIVNKSTVPVGSGDWVAMLVRDGMGAVQLTTAGGGLSAGEAPFDVVSNPEFLREGSAIHDTFFPDRIVIGSQSPRAVELMLRLYEPIITRRIPGRVPADGRQIPFVVTDLTSAELIKYAANAFLAAKISFANEIANLCERVGADMTRVALGMGLDARIGTQFLNAGLGWGGSCFPKDVSALVHIAKEYGYDAQLLRAVQETNVRQRHFALAKLQRQLKVLKGKTVTLLGLAFKPHTDDLRDAPAMTLAMQLLRLGCKVRAYDPVAADAAKAQLPALLTFPCPYQAATGADAVVLATEWPEFAALDLPRLRGLVRTPFLLDGRNALLPEAAVAAGFTYSGIGR